MSKPIETKYQIGDLVYLADTNSIDRDVIKAIKVEGLKHKISYGIKIRRNQSLFSLYFMDPSDGYDWYQSGDIFDTQEDAEQRQATLKAKAEAKAEQDRLKDIAKEEDRLKRATEDLRRKKKGLPPLEYNDDEDYEGYDD